VRSRSRSEDDGVGVRDASEIARSFGQEERFGLFSIRRKRFDSFWEGRFRIESQPGQEREATAVRPADAGETK